MEKNNIYIELLRIGAESMEEGISYNEAKAKLQAMEFNITEKIEPPLMLWFFRSFFHKEAYLLAEKIQRGEISFSKLGFKSSHPSKASQFIDTKLFIMGHAYMEYVDYIELKEAREASLKAQESAKKSIRIATWALGISALLAVGSLVLEFGSIILQFITLLFK